MFARRCGTLLLRFLLRAARGRCWRHLGYARTLDIPFVFSSNGDGFHFHDRTVTSVAMETELPLAEFPSPEQLWQKYKAVKGITDAVEAVVAQDYFSDGSNRSPRYYQQIAINRTVEAIAKNQGNNRHLLVMATGTGKTYTAFQIIYRLWKSGSKKRILFLADRTSLVDQTVRGDFRHFKEAMTVIKHKQIDTAYNIYLALYQGLSDNNHDDAYKQFSPEFFDLIIVDECHRGSARDDSKWREILEYFKGATHIGLTATPKETKQVSSSEYFGDPLYTFSLKQGIDDGFLAPYKVIKVTLDIDAEGWRPPKGFKDKEGNLVEDRIYNCTDFDKHLVVDGRCAIVLPDGCITGDGYKERIREKLLTDCNLHNGISRKHAEGQSRDGRQYPHPTPPGVRANRDRCASRVSADDLPRAGIGDRALPHPRRPSPPSRPQRSLRPGRLIDQQGPEFGEHSSSLFHANLILSELAKISVDQCSNSFLFAGIGDRALPHARRPPLPSRPQKNLCPRRLIEPQGAEFLGTLILANPR